MEMPNLGSLEEQRIAAVQRQPHEFARLMTAIQFTDPSRLTADQGSAAIEILGDLKQKYPIYFSEVHSDEATELVLDLLFRVACSYE